MMPAAQTFADVVAKLHAREPFALSRWGDGEWAAVLGKAGATVDGQTYTARLRDDLRAVLMDRPTYWLGMQGFAQRRMGGEIAAWLSAHGLTFVWVDADLFARQSVTGHLQRFIDALRLRNVVFVGPEHLWAVSSLFPVRQYVVIPDHECYDSIDRVLSATRRAMEGRPAPVVLVSAGPAANVLIHRLWTEDQGATLIDCGSLWEPYAGYRTRTYHRLVPVHAYEVRP